MASAKAKYILTIYDDIGRFVISGYIYGAKSRSQALKQSSDEIRSIYKKGAIPEGYSFEVTGVDKYGRRINPCGGISEKELRRMAHIREYYRTHDGKR